MIITTKDFYRDIIDGYANRLVGDNTFLYVSSLEGSDAKFSQMPLETLQYIIFGKKLNLNNTLPLITRVEWQHNDVYNRFSDTKGKDYVLASNRTVYKCIDNNNNSPSTIEPSMSSNIPFETADGYVWQMMYQIPVDILANKSPTGYIPALVDQNVVDNNIKGMVDYIDVTNPGRNYLTHTGTIMGVANTTVISIETSANPSDGTYVNSSLYILNGGGYNQISKISNYSSNSSGRWVTLESPLMGVALSSTYEIAPSVNIIGNGAGAKARAIVGEGGRITGISMVERGTNYSLASATIEANTIWGESATADISLSPMKGHGYDPVAELGARTLLIQVDLIGDELNTIPDDITYNRYGLVSDIREAANTSNQYSANTFNNLTYMTITYIYGEYAIGDKVYNINRTKSGTVIKSESNEIAIVLHGDDFTTSEQISSSDNSIRAIIQNINPPVASLKQADIKTITTVDPVVRHQDSTETINIIVTI